MDAGPQTMADWFFGKSFDFQNILNYTPDVTVSAPKWVIVGGSDFDLIPAPGSETPDALFIHAPDDDILFAGDFVMPFSGQPFVEEGNPDALLEAPKLIEKIEHQSYHTWAPTANWFILNCR